MKKRRKLQKLLICAISVVLFSGCTNAISIKENNKDIQESATILSEELTEYQKIVNSFIEMDLEDIDLFRQQEKSYYLYIGRETCPYCEKFVDLLAKLNLDEQAIYYIDCKVPYEEASQEMKDFRDRYLIDTVPNLLFFSNGEKTADLKSYIVHGTEEEILEFLALIDSCAEN